MNATINGNIAIVNAKDIITEVGSLCRAASMPPPWRSSLIIVKRKRGR